MPSHSKSPWSTVVEKLSANSVATPRTRDSKHLVIGHLPYSAQRKRAVEEKKNYVRKVKAHDSRPTGYPGCEATGNKLWTSYQVRSETPSAHSSSNDKMVFSRTTSFNSKLDFCLPLIRVVGGTADSLSKFPLLRRPTGQDRDPFQEDTSQNACTPETPRYRAAPNLPTTPEDCAAVDPQ
nr:hypothetical protein BgiMline_020270 [Biomphalaria glabrata]